MAGVARPTFARAMHAGHRVEEEGPPGGAGGLWMWGIGSTMQQEV